jgi:predicted glycoside hydrolase/deacetylase ChbG (UPF0249 family)
MARIILNADDYGALSCIDDGIIEGIENGVVNSVSVLVNFPNIEEAIKKLLPYRNRVKIGLHFAITCGYLDIPNQYPTMCYFDEKHKFANIESIRIHEVDPVEFEDCLKDQIAKLGRLIGGIENIDHINSHQNILYLHQPFIEALCNVLAEYDAAGKKFHLRSPVPWSKSGLIYYKKRRSLLPIQRQAARYAKSWSLLHFGKGRCKTIWSLLRNATVVKMKDVKRVLSEQGYQTPFCLVDTYYGQPTKFILTKLLEHLPEDETVEFMLHLAKDSDNNRERVNGINNGYLATREKELQTLIDHLPMGIRQVTYDPNSWA